MPAHVSLTFDDGLDCHLDTAIPVLNEFGIKGTFYIPLAAGIIGNGKASRIGDRVEEWRKAASLGHELGNHSIFHAASREKKWVPKGYATEDYTIERMRLELEVANSLLKAIDGKDDRTYAFPCSNPMVGKRGAAGSFLRMLHLDRTRLQGWVDKQWLDIGSKRENFSHILRGLFFACRNGGFEGVSAIPPFIDENLRYKVPAVDIGGADFGQLCEYTNRCINEKRWLVLTFHGIGGGHATSIDENVFKRYVEFLSREGSAKVVTFLEGARHYFRTERLYK